ncbi:hypothetical protein CspeluHIS016_0109870 [Cutaneotrichosporon spelunceum]|uniref:Uncharacterized protein n=1 Tax=Cutaneotrichosporon spelunceum TaxID=1672016 RepID=A0AAD3TP14_9TREE|nr:hypothetical protein CspeluHIS016_0109870 [Cutaneotrichosporon spelunceum]
MRTPTPTRSPRWRMRFPHTPSLPGSPPSAHLHLPVLEPEFQLEPLFLSADPNDAVMAMLATAFLAMIQRGSAARTLAEPSAQIAPSASKTSTVSSTISNPGSDGVENDEHVGIRHSMDNGGVLNRDYEVEPHDRVPSYDSEDEFYDSTDGEFDCGDEQANPFYNRRAGYSSASSSEPVEIRPPPELPPVVVDLAHMPDSDDEDEDWGNLDGIDDGPGRAAARRLGRKVCRMLLRHRSESSIYRLLRGVDVEDSRKKQKKDGTMPTRRVGEVGGYEDVATYFEVSRDVLWDIKVFDDWAREYLARGHGAALVLRSAFLRRSPVLSGHCERPTSDVYAKPPGPRKRARSRLELDEDTDETLGSPWPRAKRAHYIQLPRQSGESGESHQSQAGNSQHDSFLGPTGSRANSRPTLPRAISSRRPESAVRKSAACCETQEAGKSAAHREAQEAGEGAACREGQFARGTAPAPGWLYCQSQRPRHG